MKNQSIVVGLALLMSALIPNHLFAQTQEQTVTMAVTSSALIRVMKGTSSTSTGVNLTLGGPSEAGMQVNPMKEDISTRLRISSLAMSTTDKRQITAAITSGDMKYSKTQLELELAPPATANSANFMNYDPEGNGVTGLQILGNNDGNSTAVTLVNNILTCWSGTTDGDGYVIHYKYSNNVLGTPTARTVVVTFTIQAQPAI